MFERFEKLVDVTAPPPREQPPQSLRALYRYFLSEHRRLFLALMLTRTRTEIRARRLKALLARERVA